MINQAIPIFRRQYLDETQTSSMPSEPVAAEGNEAVLAITGINVSSGTLTVSMEGSYDGLAWSNLVTASGLTDFGFTTVSKPALDVAWVRARAVVATGTKAIFCTRLAYRSAPDN